MHSVVRAVALIAGSAALAAAGAAAQAGAPSLPNGTGRVVGYVTDSAGTPLAGATVQVIGTRLGARSAADGRYHLEAVPAGRAAVTMTYVGFAPDTGMVDVAPNRTTTHTVRMRSLGAYALAQMLILASPRLSETRAAALAKQRDADNILSVLSGDEIRSLPNFNAAEAAGRIPGVSLERDEGEGKFVQVRGTEPRLSNVTIDGSHVPGTESDRIPKLDDVPSDILGAIEVSKTLTADMDADAIGGSVNLVTKTPEGAPHGYVSAQYGAITLLSKSQFQGGFAYGGRFGEDGKLGLLLGGSADRNGRVINDLEPGWAVDGSGRAIPIEWNQRDYVYRRTRYGLGGDVDYRFSNGANIAIKGMFSRLENFGTTYYSDIVTGATPSTFNGNGDSASSGGRGYATGVEVSQIAGNHKPLDQLYGGTMSGRTQLGPFAAKLIVNAARTTENIHDHRFSPFVYDGPGGQGLTVAYNASDTKTPTY